MSSPLTMTNRSPPPLDTGTDEVDFVKTPTNICVSCTKNQSQPQPPHANNNNNSPKLNVVNFGGKRRPSSGRYGDCEMTSCVKSHLSTLDRLQIFNFQFRKGSDPNLSKTKRTLSSASTKEKVKFMKSNSIARLFGNTYNTKKLEENPPVVAARRFRGAEKFFKSPDDETRLEDEISLQDFTETNDDVSAKAIKRITRGLGKLLRRNCSSVDISVPDPEYKVSYLGNVLTGWAKGDACMEKPLATLWRNYTQNNKPDVLMRLQVCPSGLKATTRQHGLTEYWAHRVTHCCAPKNYPKVFCWIYRHEGRRLKHELRCHAVICSKETIAQEISTRLKENLATALREFKRDKISKQNARLSLANAVYDNPSMPRRKILLSVGANHYRPPLERSKSAPKLMAIEEIVGEEEEEEERENETTENQRPCCKEDLLYSASTFGRRHCKRGHSLRRAKLRSSLLRQQCVRDAEKIHEATKPSELQPPQQQTSVAELQPITVTRSLGSESDDDFEEFLLSTNYNSKDALSGEFISYLDMKLKPTTVSMHDLYQARDADKEDGDNLKFETMRNTMSLDDLNDYCTDVDDDEEDADDVFYSHDHVLEVLHHQKQFQHSISAPTSMSTAMSIEQTMITERIYNGKNDPSDDVSCPPSLICVTNKLIGNLDSDEGSISSGCETSSTVTNITITSEVVETPKRCSVLERVRSFEQLAENNVNCVPVGEKRPFENHTLRHPYSKAFQRSITFPGPGGLMRSNFNLPPPPIAAINKQLITQLESVDADSDVSDESGYVEFQENNTCKVKSIVT